MQITKIKLLLALIPLWTAPSFAGDEGFITRFKNNTDTTIDVTIRYSNNSFQKSDVLSSGSRNNFNYRQSCNQEHTRKFEVVDKDDSNAVIADGEFTMTTGEQGGGLNFARCKNVEFNITCNGLSDSFDIVCSADGTNKKKIEIK